MPLEDALIKHASPTLAGLKMASLFRYCPENKRRFGFELKRWQDALSPFGLRLAVLHGCQARGGYLLYLYRPESLKNALAKPDIRAFLRQYGYEPCTGVLRQLSKRISMSDQFPHEIGVFLGYPLEDVLGFIQNQGKNYTYCGCWKAYGDPNKARKAFERYRLCTKIYSDLYTGGTPITRLIVAA